MDTARLYEFLFREADAPVARLRLTFRRHEVQPRQQGSGPAPG